MKIKLDVNLKTSKKFYPKGTYDGDFFPELVAELEVGGRHISEIGASTTLAETVPPNPLLSFEVEAVEFDNYEPQLPPTAKKVTKKKKPTPKKTQTKKPVAKKTQVK